MFIPKTIPQYKRAIHMLLEDIWGDASVKNNRSSAYIWLAKKYKKTVHIADIKSEKELRQIWIDLVDLKEMLPASRTQQKKFLKGLLQKKKKVRAKIKEPVVLEVKTYVDYGCTEAKPTLPWYKRVWQKLSTGLA